MEMRIDLDVFLIPLRKLLTDWHSASYPGNLKKCLGLRKVSKELKGNFNKN